jgi:hypothetical protein
MADDAPSTLDSAKPTGGVIRIGDKPFMIDASGAYKPLGSIKPQHLLEDETVRKILGFAEPLRAEIARFRQHTFDDVDSLLDVLLQEYKAPKGGKKGNVTLMSFDGLIKVIVTVADLIAFGPELQAAKALIDECLADWSADGSEALQAFVAGAFSVDKGGINRAALLKLLRVEVPDERWARAMKAISDSVRIVGAKRYVNIYRRPTQDAGWERVSIDAASA